MPGANPYFDSQIMRLIFVRLVGQPDFSDDLGDQWGDVDRAGGIPTLYDTGRDQNFVVVLTTGSRARRHWQRTIRTCCVRRGDNRCERGAIAAAIARSNRWQSMRQTALVNLHDRAHTCGPWMKNRSGKLLLYCSIAVAVVLVAAAGVELRCLLTAINVTSGA